MVHTNLIRWTLALVLSVLMLPALPSHSAELAERSIFGYSDNGRYFAFEQFGIQDGSGFAYSEVFILDLVQDRWVPGGPIRVLREEDGASLRGARREAHDQARPRLNQYGIGAPFRVLASTTPLESGSQEEVMEFNPRAILTPIDPLHTLRLENLPMNSSRESIEMVDTAGFALSLQVQGGAKQTIYRDTHLPSSRVYPTRYGISDVVVPFDGSPGRAVALISVYQLGFEGLDRRFLAVPFDLSF